MTVCPNRLRHVVGVESSYKLLPIRNDIVAWSEEDYIINSYPKILNGGVFMQPLYKKIPKYKAIKVVVRGKAEIYVAFGYGSNNSRGYENALQENGWNKEDGEITFGETSDIKLDKIFSKTFQGKLPYSELPSTTEDIFMLVIVVSICEGRFTALMNYNRIKVFKYDVIINLI